MIIHVQALLHVSTPGGFSGGTVNGLALAVIVHVEELGVNDETFLQAKVKSSGGDECPGTRESRLHRRGHLPTMQQHKVRVVGHQAD